MKDAGSQVLLHRNRNHNHNSSASSSHFTVLAMISPTPPLKKSTHALTETIVNKKLTMRYIFFFLLRIFLSVLYVLPPLSLFSRFNHLLINLS